MLMNNILYSKLICCNVAKCFFIITIHNAKKLKNPIKNRQIGTILK